MAEQRREIVKQILEEKKTEKPVRENPELIRELEKKEIDDYEKHKNNSERDFIDEDESDKDKGRMKDAKEKNKIRSLTQDKARSESELSEKKAEHESKTNQVSEKQSSKNEKLEDTKKEKKEDKKSSEPVIKGKMKEAVVNGKDLGISIKHAIAICNFIKGKDIDDAIFELEDVMDMKRAIPMRGEIPHRKGMMSGRYPVKAAEQFIRLLKSLRANAIYHELELEKFKIACMANVASRPLKRFGQSRFKRCHVQIKLINRREKK